MSFDAFPIASDTYRDPLFPFHIESYQTGGDSIRDFPLRLTTSAIRALGSLRNDWDRRGSLAPTAAIIVAAQAWTKELNSSLHDIGLQWTKPHVSASEDGAVVFEWWNDDKKLTLYLSDQEAEFVKVWGTNIHTEMADGKITKASFRDAWNWLVD